jgi:hypothetical protein
MYCMEEPRKRRWMKNLSEQVKKKGKQMRSLWYDVLSIQFGYGLGWLGSGNLRQAADRRVWPTVTLGELKRTGISKLEGRKRIDYFTWKG